MLRRIFPLVILLLALPGLACAWTLTVKVTGPSGVAGNNVTVSGGASKTMTAGSSTLYPTSAATASVNTAAGYTSTLTVDGIASAASSVSFSSGSHIVAVAYASAGPSVNSVTISQTTGGTVSLQLPNSTYTTTGASGLAIGTSLPVTIAAAPGYSITGYTINGITTAHTGAIGEVLSVPAFQVTTTPVPNTVSATFSLVASITASLSAPVSGITGQAVAFSANATSNDTGLQYSFAVTGVPAGSTVSSTPQGPGATQTFSFIPDLAGVYTVQLVVTSAGGGSVTTTASVTVVAAVANSVSQCTSCHSTSTPQVVADYNSSLHLNKISCVDCHTPAPHVALPTSSVCVGCHADSSGNVPLHPFVIGVNPCLTCHNPHTVVGINGSTVMPPQHFNNVTSGVYPASYLTSGANCDDCHYYKDPNAANRHDWAASGHAAVTAPAWTAYDFKTRSGCVQCHTTTGFIAYSSAKVTTAWGVASDKTKELLKCTGCHSNISTGAVRPVTPATPFAGDSYQNRDRGNSNICLNCHSGTNNGAGIQAKLPGADFSNLPFVAPHRMTAGGTLQGVSGFHFPGRVYATYSSNSHREVGMASAPGVTPAGPCVSCHMSSPQTHLYQAVATDPISGAISAITSSVCVTCHAGTLDATQLNADRALYQNALTVLQALLASKGFVYSASYPYFSNTNWGTGQAGANAMGAAYNYALLVSEPGAYAHNALYAKQLVLDSIDYLDNGQFDDSVATLAVPGLLASGAISQTVADSFVAYKTKQNLCTSCHGFTAASGRPIATGGHPAHLSSAYGPGGYLGSDVSACQACHVSNSTSHNNGVVDLVAGACLGCHAGTTPTWTPGRLACTGCHSATPALLPNGVAAPYKANFTSTGHGQFAPTNQCTACHDANSNHISGSLGTYQRLLLANDNNLCASCHNSAVVGVAFRNMSTHVTKDGRPLNCRDCHDPHGSTNLSMIRSQINGVTIVFTDKINAFVDPVSNQGLCQVCHTLTSHYQAGVPETGHYTSGCLNCHTHNAAGGAFRPVGGACDSCHGYPPAPKNVALAFGTAGNWANARFEDYSGGGGAHLVVSHISPNATPDQGWANCAVCHNGGASGGSSYHKMLTPVASHISNVKVLVDPALRFSDGFTVYTSAKLVNPPAVNATGSCFNISCHMTQSPRWSTER